MGVGDRLLQLTDLPVGGGQAEQRRHLGMAHLALEGQEQGLVVVMVERLGVLAQVPMNGGEGVERVGLVALVADLAGQGDGGVG